MAWAHQPCQTHEHRLKQGHTRNQASPKIKQTHRAEEEKQFLHVHCRHARQASCVVSKIKTLGNASSQTVQVPPKKNCGEKKGMEKNSHVKETDRASLHEKKKGFHF